MKKISQVFIALFLGMFPIQAKEETSEHIREESDLPRIHSAVLPLDLQEGTALDPLGDNEDKFSGELPWFNEIKKSRGQYLTIKNEVPNYEFIFENPIIAFGSSAGGSPLYVDQSYKFGINFGRAEEANSVRIHEILISAYPKSAFNSGESNIASTHRIPIPIPEEGTEAWSGFVNNGYKIETLDNQTGLNVVLTLAKNRTENQNPDDAVYCVLELRASQPDYYFKIETAESYKIGDTWYPAVKSVDEQERPAPNILFTVDFNAAETTETLRRRVPRRVRVVSRPVYRPRPVYGTSSRVTPISRVQNTWRQDQQRQEQRRADQRAETNRQQQRQVQQRQEQRAEERRQEQRRADQRTEERRQEQRRA
ncbi:MAG: hypothetical protein C5B47_08830, partial [Verrucomicrobia bacterium]